MHTPNTKQGSGLLKNLFPPLILAPSLSVQFGRYARYRDGLHSPWGGPLAAVVRDGAVYEGPHVALPPPGDVQRQHACTNTV